MELRGAQVHTKYLDLSRPVARSLRRHDLQRGGEVLSNGCLYLTEKSHFDGGFLSNLTRNSPCCAGTTCSAITINWSVPLARGVGHSNQLERRNTGLCIQYWPPQVILRESLTDLLHEGALVAVCEEASLLGLDPEHAQRHGLIRPGTGRDDAAELSAGYPCGAEAGAATN